MTTLQAPPSTSILEFKRLVIQTLCGDELTRRVTALELMLGERLLENSATLEESGLSPDEDVLAVFSRRSVECRAKEESAYALNLPDQAVMLRIPAGTVEIPPFAFLDSTSIVSVSIPDSVTRIGVRAFDGCSSLISLTLPKSLTTISDLAFLACSSLESLTLPESLTEIRAEAFSGCSSLRSLTIPESMTHIAPDSFYDCSCLVSLEIPDSVESIGDRAFGGCSALTSLSIPDSVDKVGHAAFSGCSSLAKLTIPVSVSLTQSFQGCPSTCVVSERDSSQEKQCRACFDLCYALGRGDSFREARGVRGSSHGTC